MNRFLSYVLSVRGLVSLAIIATACTLSAKFSEHHEQENVFTELYMHLIPAALVTHEAGPEMATHALVEIPLPGFLSAMDYRGETESAEPKTTIFNLQIFQIAAVLLVFVAFSGVPSYLRTGKGDALTRLLAGFCMYVRDEMVYPEMGREMGRKFLPYFLSVFFFILFMNLMGLVPYSATATASIFVTGALALTTFLAMLGCGMAVQGVVPFWKNLVPHVPALLWPLMFLVELIGLLVKPCALMIRMFANLTGGHMVVLSFMGLIFFMAGNFGSTYGWLSSPLGAGFAVFIMIIESFVALVQAYIFTQLSIIFVNASVHPEH